MQPLYTTEYIPAMHLRKLVCATYQKNNVYGPTLPMYVIVHLDPENVTVKLAIKYIITANSCIPLLLYALMSSHKMPTITLVTLMHYHFACKPAHFPLALDQAYREWQRNKIFQLSVVMTNVNLT
jgi:hypothetical protein